MMIFFLLAILLISFTLWSVHTIWTFTHLKKNNARWILVPSIICALLIYSMIGNWDAEALRLHSPATLATTLTSTLASDLAAAEESTSSTSPATEIKK